jgi:hypothetical protein
MSDGLTHVKPGQPISARNQNDLIDAVARTQNMWGSGHAAINSAGGIQTGFPLPEDVEEPVPEIDLRGPVRKSTQVVAIIQSIETGGGIYQGAIILGNPSIGPSNNQNMTGSYPNLTNGAVPPTWTGPTNTALIVNLSENGLGDVHTLVMNSWIVGHVIGYSSETPPRPIVAANPGFSSPVFAVTVTQTGGFNGTSASPASWTYKVMTVDGTVTLGVNISLTRPRPNGSMAPGNAFGLAFYQPNGNLQLWDAGEIPN